MAVDKKSIRLSRTEWEGILRELGEYSVYYHLIKAQVGTRIKNIDHTKVGTKRTRRINKEKSWLTKQAELRRSALKKKETIYEKIAQQAIKELGIPYAIQKIFFYGSSFYIADIYLTTYKVVLELDGRQHYEEANMTKDAIRTENLLELGVRKVIRLPNNKCNTTSVKTLINETIKELTSLEEN